MKVQKSTRYPTRPIQSRIIYINSLLALIKYNSKEIEYIISFHFINISTKYFLEKKLLLLIYLIVK